MHVAICDDNIADRKHLERLLGRESDKRAGTPNILYIDSFGNKDQFLAAPLKYDIIFMDMCQTPTLCEEIVLRLLEVGLDAPLVLYSSKIDYSLNPKFQNNELITFMSKPYIPDPLPELLKLGDAHVIGDIETITVRFKDNIPHYVPKDDILYGLKTSDGSTSLYLRDMSIIELGEDMHGLRVACEPYHEFALINKNVIVNIRYVPMITPFTVISQDYNQFHYNPLKYNDLKKLKERIDAER